MKVVGSNPITGVRLAPRCAPTCLQTESKTGADIAALPLGQNNILPPMLRDVACDMTSDFNQPFNELDGTN
jgi:hypothetical protein